MTNVTKASVINFIMAKLDGSDITADKLNAMSVDKLLQKYNYTLDDVSIWMSEPNAQSKDYPVALDDSDYMRTHRDDIVRYVTSCNTHIDSEKLKPMLTTEIIDRFMLDIDVIRDWCYENPENTATAEKSHNTRKFTINFRDGANAIAVFTKSDDGSWKLSYKSTRLRWMDDDQKIYDREYDPTNPEPRNIINTIPRTDETNLNWCLSQPNYDEQLLTV